MLNLFEGIILCFFLLLKQHLGLIMPMGNSTKELKEFQMHRIQVRKHEIDRAVAQYKHLPTSIMQWSTTSQI